MFPETPLPPAGKNPTRPNGFLYLIILALFITGLYFVFSNRAELIPAEEVSLSKIQEEYKQNQLKSLQIRENKIIAETTDGKIQNTYRLPTDGIKDLGFDDLTKDIPVTVEDTEGSRFWMEILSSLIPFLLIAAFLLYMLKQAQKGTANAFSFGKSRARLFDKNKAKNRITFKDVAGAEEEKEELSEIVDFLKHPKKYLNMGAKIPKGVLLMGPPGTGKTLLARAVAGEANVPFLNISGSEFVEMFVGVGASRVRDLFMKAKRNAPAIIFIDEIDAVGSHRGAGLGGGHDEREQTLNQILAEMDGFEQGTNVIVIAATNRPDVLDPALLRPGRFDRRVVIELPDIRDRLAVLKVHSRNKPLDKEINLEKIAKQTPGFSGADLENLMNEAAILATKHGHTKIKMKDAEDSVEKVMMGPEKKSRILTEEEKKITAYHEAGHAVVGHLLPHCDPVHKISLIGRGMTLGATWFLPKQDLYLQSRSKFKDELASLLGGREAEQLVFNEITTGATNDLKRATQIARRMVAEYGMSNKIGPVFYADQNASIFLGKDLIQRREHSEKMAALIDMEVKRIVEEASKKAREILTQNRTVLDKIVVKLLEKEILLEVEFVGLFGGKLKAKG